MSNTPINDERLAEVRAWCSETIAKGLAVLEQGTEDPALSEALNLLTSMGSALEEVAFQRRQILRQMARPQAAAARPKCWIEVVTVGGDAHRLTVPDLSLSYRGSKLGCPFDDPTWTFETFDTATAQTLAAIFFDPNIVAARLDPVFFNDQKFIEERDSEKESTLFAREASEVGPVLDDALEVARSLRERLEKTRLALTLQREYTREEFKRGAAQGVRAGIEVAASLAERARCRDWSPTECGQQIRQHFEAGRLDEAIARHEKEAT